MKKYSRILALVLMLVMCVALFAGCAGKAKTADKDWDYVKDAGKMVIGITDYEPMNYYDANGTLVGFDTDLTQAVCDYLGVDAEFIEINWDNKETELNSYNIDCIWNGFTYTEDRDKNLDFSEHYLYNQIVLVVRTEDLGKYTSTADLADARICAEGGSSGETCVLEDEYLSTADYTAVDSLVDSLMEVAAGVSDAAAVDSTMAYYLVGEGAYSGLSIIDGVVLSQEELAAGFRTDSSLTAKVNEALDALVADGTYATIAEKYGLTDVLILG